MRPQHGSSSNVSLPCYISLLIFSLATAPLASQWKTKQEKTVLQLLVISVKRPYLIQVTHSGLHLHLSQFSTVALWSTTKEFKFHICEKKTHMLPEIYCIHTRFTTQSRSGCYKVYPHGKWILKECRSLTFTFRLSFLLDVKNPLDIQYRT